MKFVFKYLKSAVIYYENNLQNKQQLLRQKVIWNEATELTNESNEEETEKQK